MFRLLRWVSFCLVIGFSAGLCVESVGVRAEERPNILFLFADDMRADTIAAHGNPHIQTPHIDELIGSGFSFRQNYIFGGNSGAVCVPSRAMLMTGKTWFDVNVENLNQATLMPEWFAKHGYKTFATGKWHNGQASWLRSFQRGKSVMFGGMSDHTRVPIRDLQSDGTLSDERIAESFSSELFADAAIEFLGRHKESVPFFLYVAFTAPHDPRQPPPSFADEYYKKNLPLPKNFLPQHPFDNGMVKNLRDENLASWPRTEATIRDQLAEYYGMITHMDQQVGRIVQALKDAGQFENTLIVFAADNGLAIGSHGLLGKQNVYEHSMKVPLVISGPGIAKSKSTEALTYLLDLFPTLCDKAGLPAPEGMRGTSLQPILEGKKQSVRNTLFLPYLKIQRAIRDERWKLIVYPKIHHFQLFDLASDPWEMKNLYGDSEHREVIDRLLAEMHNWQKEMGDGLEIPRESRTPDPIDLTDQKRVPDKWQPEWIVKKYFE